MKWVKKWVKWGNKWVFGGMGRETWVLAMGVRHRDMGECMGVASTRNFVTFSGV